MASMTDKGDGRMELIESYLEKAKRVRGVYVLKVRDIEEDVLHEIAVQWSQWLKKGIIDAPLIMIPDFVELDYEKVFTFERAMQILRSKGMVRRRAWKTNSYLFVSVNGTIMKYIDQNCIIPYEVKTEDLEAVDWELYSLEW